MALTANREVDRFVDQELRSYAVAASKNVFKGGFVGLSAGGYAQPLAAGDAVAGIAYEAADNTAGQDGDVMVRVFTLGDFGMTLAGATTANIGQSVFASDDATLTFDPDGHSFVGYVQDVMTANDIVLRLDIRKAVGMAAIWHHTTGFSLTPAQSGTVHTNLAAVGVITATLPQSPPKGTTFQFVCMADQELRLDPGLAGGVYIKGAKQADTKYVSITDIGDFIHVVADGNGDWVAIASISGADADITVQL